MINDIDDASNSLFAASQSAAKYNLQHMDIIYKDNMNKQQVIQKMDRKLRQRPSIDGTMARGILLHRTDTKLNLIFKIGINSFINAKRVRLWRN